MFLLEIKDVTAKLEVINVHGVERISEPYEFKLEVLSSDSSLTKYIGKEATFTFVVGRAKTIRHGILNRVTVVEADNLKVRYQLSLVPAIARLELKSNCRIFQDITIQDVLEDILQEHDISAFQIKLSGTHSAKTYLVQYRETDLDFLHRLIEQAGLFYYFKHHNDHHTLIIADDAAEYQDIPGGSPSLRYEPSSVQTERVTEFSLSRIAAAKSVRLRDYNYETPAAKLEVSKKALQTANSSNELYDYPGGYQHRNEGQSRVRWRLDAERVHTLSAKAATNIPRFSPGHTFKLMGHRYPAANQAYVLIEVIHDGEQEPSSSSSVRYQNSMKCISAKVPYRSTGRYPALVMQGPQTATVVGPAGEEIFVDDQGRIKIQFHWDRTGQFDENSSAWIRVTQASAGKGWGHISIPRIGNEVLVDFVNGDPHQPVIIGSLYNGSNQVPYSLPKNKTVTALKTRTSPNGSGFNELRFDDIADNELVSLHAQKDFSMAVQNNFVTAVGNNHKCNIGKQYFCKVGDKATLNAKSILLKATETIEFKVGNASIMMNKNGDIQIVGKQIDIKSRGKLTLKGSNIP